MLLVMLCILQLMWKGSNATVNCGISYSKFRAGGNGTASTAMAVPVFEREKWRCLDSNLTCVIECPLQALCHSLGRLRGL